MDFSFRNHGSICILTPTTAQAREWVSDNLPADAQAWGGGIVIEPRYADPILNAIVADGMSFGAVRTVFH